MTIKENLRQRRPLIVGNWKMHGHLKTNAQLLRQIIEGLGEPPSSEVAVCVPFPYLAQCQQLCQHNHQIKWGAQDVSAHSIGAYTGEVAASMLSDFDCRYVIVGHSERRTYHTESDHLIAQKTLQALAKGITPIICVGESLGEHESSQTKTVITQQLEAVLSVLSSNNTQTPIVVAYEPIWAIGTGKTALPSQVQEVHCHIRQLLGHKHKANVKILYGGSIKPENASTLLSLPEVDGGLIGGSSLQAKDFLDIVYACASVER